MIQTAKSDNIDDFLAFLGELAKDTDWPGDFTQHCGAADAEIAELQSYSPFPFPSLYRGYLRCFGVDAGSLDVSDGGKPSLPSVLGFYQALSDDERKSIPAHAMIIALDGITGGRALKWEAGMQEPRVVVVWRFRHLGHDCAESYRNWLYQQAYAIAQFRETGAGAPAVWWKHKGKLLPDAVSFAQGNGFAFYWFSDSCVGVAERDDAWLLLRQYPDRFVLYVRAKENCTVATLGDAFAKELNLRCR